MIKEEPQLLQEKTIRICLKIFPPRDEMRNNAVVENCYFQQDGTPAHYTRQVRDYLSQLFLDR